MKKLILIISLLALSFPAWSQQGRRGPASKQTRGVRAPANNPPTAPAPAPSSSEELDAMIGQSETAPVAQASAQTNSPPAGRLSNNSTAGLDPFRQGWKSRDFSRSLGFSTGLVGTSNAIVFENTPDADSSWGFHFGFLKSTDGFTETNTTSTAGVGPTTTTTSLSRSGTKNPMTLSFASTYMLKVYKNDFILVRWGGLGGLDYFTEAKYQTGSRSTSESSATPGTISISESAYGDVSVKRSPTIRMGPVFDTAVYLRWFPNLSAGFLGGILFISDQKVTTTTSTVTRSYQSIGGVDQAPTSNTVNQSEAQQNLGPSLSTYALAGQNFNIFGTFVIRYLW